MSDLRISFPSPCSENWDDMKPLGCNRFCATCSETIHELSELTSQEAETLLRMPGSHCVRAQVDGSNGSLKVKLGSSANQRKILVAVGASIGLLTSACETLPQASSAVGLIVGRVDIRSGVKSVVLISDKGQTYRTKIHSDGSYKFKPLPYGTYSIKFVDDCADRSGGTVVLHESSQVVEGSSPTYNCIVVGMVKIEEQSG